MSTDFDRARRLLAADRALATERLTILQADFRRLLDAAGSTTLDDEHDPEGITIAFERGQLAALIEQTEARLRDVETAYERIAAGTYAHCERCAAAIGSARLEARPTTRLCIGCARSRR